MFFYFKYIKIILFLFLKYILSVRIHKKKLYIYITYFKVRKTIIFFQKPSVVEL
jgi:hypothetical protein